MAFKTILQAVKNDEPIASVIEAIATEREYQARRWGKRQRDGSFKEAKHSTEEFMVYMQDYLTEAFHQISRQNSDEATLDTLRKVVTLGVACFEQHGVSERDLSVPIVNGRDGKPA